MSRPLLSKNQSIEIRILYDYFRIHVYLRHIPDGQKTDVDILIYIDIMYILKEHSDGWNNKDKRTHQCEASEEVMGFKKNAKGIRNDDSTANLFSVVSMIKLQNMSGGKAKLWRRRGGSSRLSLISTKSQDSKTVRVVIYIYIYIIHCSSNITCLLRVACYVFQDSI